MYLTCQAIFFTNISANLWLCITVYTIEKLTGLSTLSD